MWITRTARNRPREPERNRPRVTAAEAGDRAAAGVLRLLDETGHRVLGVATGSSPQPLYAALPTVA
ncbi:MAG: hypothetical protein KDB60_08130 [Propionibacteriaceae bacterium]|nr:hypothetical protein [Propionibacteriaceae bacterium]